MEKRQFFQQTVLRKLDSNMQNKTGPLPYAIHKNKLKMDERPECETGNHQNPRGENSNLFDFGCSNFLLDLSLESREMKANMNY